MMILRESRSSIFWISCWNKQSLAPQFYPSRESDGQDPVALIFDFLQKGQYNCFYWRKYETDRAIPGYCLAPIIYGPSYLSYGTFTYRDVPSAAYPLGVVLHVENGYGFALASPEKAICDMLYIRSPLKNQSELESLLFEDLRIDRDEFFHLNQQDLVEIAQRYHTQNHKLLQAYLRRRMRNRSYIISTNWTRTPSGSST